MAGEKNLGTLVQSMSPRLLDGEFVFCSFTNSTYGDHAELQPIASFTESEGLSLIIPKARADDNNIDYESVYKAITLEVHSSLDAVGLTALVSGKLTEHSISSNVVAGYYHDHIFVKAEHAEKAISALDEIAC